MTVIPIQKQQLDNKLVNAAPMTRRQYLEKMQWPHDPASRVRPILVDGGITGG